MDCWFFLLLSSKTLAEKKAEQINLVTINIYKQGMAFKCEGYYEDTHNGYVIEIATEDIISASFDYDRDTIEDVFLKLIEPNEFVNLVHRILTI